MPIRNLAQFNSAVAAATRRIPREAIVTFQKRIAFEVFVRTAEKTPVRTGRARRGWDLTVGSPPSDAVDREPNGAVVEAKLVDLPPFEVVYIGNLVFYVVFLEDGSSSQAPQGMLAVSLAEVAAFIR